MSALEIDGGDLGRLPLALKADVVAEIYGISTDHLYALVRDDACPVPPLKLGRSLRWATKAVLESLAIDVDVNDSREVSNSNLREAS